MKIMLIPSLLVSVALVGCGSNNEGTVSEYESSRLAAKTNCQFNVDAYIEQGGLDMKVIMDTDSSISRKYLQGDGYCSGNIVKRGSLTKSKLYCGSGRGDSCKTVRPSVDGKPNPNLDHSKPIQK